jgi:hypothetical protein
VSCDAADYSTLAQVYSLTSRHKLRSRIGDNIIIILVYYNILRKTKRLITTFGKDVNHKVMLCCQVNSVLSQHKLVTMRNGIGVRVPRIPVSALLRRVAIHIVWVPSHVLFAGLGCYTH